MSATLPDKDKEIEKAVADMLREMGIRRVSAGHGQWGYTEDYDDHGLFIVTDEKYANQRSGHNWMEGRLKAGDLLLREGIAGDHFHRYAFLKWTSDGMLKKIQGIEVSGYEGLAQKVLTVPERIYHTLKEGFPVPANALGLAAIPTTTPEASLVPEKASIGGVYKVNSAKDTNAKMVGNEIGALAQPNDLMMCFGQSAQGHNGYAFIEIGANYVKMAMPKTFTSPYRIGDLVHTFTQPQALQIVEHPNTGFDTEGMGLSRICNAPNSHYHGAHKLKP